jgi:hypothetical protein
MESMAEGFAERGLVSSDEKAELVRLSFEYLDTAVERGLAPKMSYRGRAAGVILKAVRDLELQVPETDIARAAGFDKRTMETNADVVDALLKDSKRS